MSEDTGNLWLKMALDTSPIDVEKSLAAMKTLYEQAGSEIPEKYEIYPSPMAAIRAMKEKYGFDVTSDDFLKGALELPGISLISEYAKILDHKSVQKLEPLVELARHCGWCLVFDNMVVLTEKPIRICLDENNKLHNDDGFALEYSNGDGIRSIHGETIID